MVCIIIIAFIALVGSILIAPVLSLSSNQCSSCHGSTYSQQIDILEGNAQNFLPATIQVGETQTVRVLIENINNAPRYTQFTGVTATLTSQNGHFSVSSQTVNIGTLYSGTTTAIWQITGFSTGTDTLLISTSATNTHFSLRYSDSYSPSPTINVIPGSASTPTSTPISTPIPTATPSPTPTNTLTSTPARTSPQTNTPQPSNPNNTSPTQNPTSAPTTQPSVTPLQPTTNTPSPTFQTEQDDARTKTDALNSTMLYIHPPLAIIGYVLIFMFGILILTKKYETKITRITGKGLWIFTLLGLLTGMVWAQFSWGSYWSWDLKETLTLTLFLTASAGQIFYFQKLYKATKWIAIITCGLVIITGLSSVIVAGLHSYL